jgi:hypothetical protein
VLGVESGVSGGPALGIDHLVLLGPQPSGGSFCRYRTQCLMLATRYSRFARCFSASTVCRFESLIVAPDVEFVDSPFELGRPKALLGACNAVGRVLEVRSRAEMELSGNLAFQWADGECSLADMCGDGVLQCGPVRLITNELHLDLGIT